MIFLKRLFLVFLLLSVAINLVSCGEKLSSEEIMSEFMKAYSIDGELYSSGKGPADDGYINDKLFRSIYRFEGELPSDFSIFLGAHIDSPSECGAFKADDAELREELTEMCLERIRTVLGSSDKGLVLRCDSFVFYAILPDLERAEAVFRRIIG